MARRHNYGGEKRQREIQRQRKKDEKAEKKRLKKESPTAAEQDEGVVGPGQPDAADMESEIHPGEHHHRATAEEEA